MTDAQGPANVFALRASGNAEFMTQMNSGTNQESVNKARRATAKVTAPAAKVAGKAAEKSDDVAAEAVGVAERTAGAGAAVVRGAAGRVQAGRRAVVSASGHAVGLARTAWTVVARRKAVAAGAGVGLSAMGALSYLAGRRAGRRTRGPITRLTGGRI
ncbi:hypothetical protein GCM10009566_02130 [Streptomyces murinus]